VIYVQHEVRNYLATSWARTSYISTRWCLLLY